MMWQTERISRTVISVYIGRAWQEMKQMSAGDFDTGAGIFMV